MVLYVLGTILNFSLLIVAGVLGYAAANENFEIIDWVMKSDAGRTINGLTFIGTIGLLIYNFKLSVVRTPHFTPILVSGSFLINPFYSIWILSKKQGVKLSKPAEAGEEDSEDDDVDFDYMQGADPDAGIEGLEDAEEYAVPATFPANETGQGAPLPPPPPPFPSAPAPKAPEPYRYPLKWDMLSTKSKIYLLANYLGGAIVFLFILSVVMLACSHAVNDWIKEHVGLYAILVYGLEFSALMVGFNIVLSLMYDTFGYTLRLFFFNVFYSPFYSRRVIRNGWFN